MNYYKFRLMVKEFSFLDEVLRRKENSFSVDWESSINLACEFYGNKFGFKMDVDGNYIIPSYIEIPDELKISRGDENLLSQTPNYDSYSWCDGGHDDYISYCAVVGGQIFWLKSEGSSRTGSGDNYEEDAPIIGDQLAQLKINPDYIVCINFQDTDDNDNGYAYKKVVIYKMNKFNLTDYHCRQIDKAVSQLKAEITAICKGGSHESA